MKKTFWGCIILGVMAMTAACTQLPGPIPEPTATTAAAAAIVEPTRPATATPPAATLPPPTATAIPVTATPTAEPTATAAPVAEAHEESETVSEGVVPAEPIALPPNAFIETFDGEPASPQVWHPDGWDVVVHSRDIETWYQLEPMEAHHGPGCEAPDVTHTVTDYEDALFNCRNHMMTSLNASGYGVLYFTPAQLIDLSDKAVISIDVSTYRHANRDWWDIWITPYDDYVQAPLENFFPDLAGPPANAIHIRMPDNPNLFFAEQIVDYEVVTGDFEDEWISYEYFLEPDKARRDTFVFEYDNGRIRFGMPEYDVWWVDKELPVPLDWDKAVVQIGHHSYNPEKSCDYDGSCGPNTWHWDNLVIAPAEPFTIISSVDRFAKNESETMAFRQPAPADAELRFMGIGGDLEVSFDDGKSWVEAEPVPINVEEIKDEHFRFYRVSIPAGIQTVRFRGEDKWGGVIPWHVRNASIWSLNPSGNS